MFWQEKNYFGWGKTWGHENLFGFENSPTFEERNKRLIFEINHLHDLSCLWEDNCIDSAHTLLGLTKQKILDG